jgi:glycosyltransferase involved in cell wall biosynthesis
MKILLINNSHYIRGGADSVYFNTAKLLQNNGHKVFFFSMSHPNNYPYDYSDYFVNNVDYRNLSLIGKVKAIPSFVFNRDAYKQLLYILEIIKPDIAHIHLYMGGLTSSILKALTKKNIPIVHTVHDYRLICPTYLFLDGENKVCERCKNGMFLQCIVNRCSENSLPQSSILTIDAYFRKYIMKSTNYIDRFIFVSQFSMNKHIEFDSSFQYASDQLYNFMLNFDLAIPSKSRGQYFLYFGRLSREKGVMTLIEAAKSSDFKLKIVGTGPLFSNLKENSTKNIEFLGYKQGEELYEIIRNASFVIIPSEWYENNPMTIIESYSFGKPVIGADIGGIPEIIIENETGYLFNSGNHIELSQVINKATRLSSEQYRLMSNNARNFAEEFFNPIKHYKKLSNIYRETINKARNI